MKKMLSKIHIPSFLVGILVTMIVYSALGWLGVAAIVVIAAGWGKWRMWYFCTKGILRRHMQALTAIVFLCVVSTGCSVGIDSGRNTRAIAEADSRAQVQIAREDSYARAAEAEYRYLARQSDAAARIEVAEIRSMTRLAIFNNMSIALPMIAGIVVLGIMAILYMSNNNKRQDMDMMARLLYQQQGSNRLNMINEQRALDDPRPARVMVKQIEKRDDYEPPMMIVE